MAGKRRRKRKRKRAEETGDTTVSISRVIFGLHFIIVAGAFLVFLGNELDLYGRDPVFVAGGVSLAVIVLVRPHLVLTASGVEFVAKVCFIFSVPYATIEPERIRAVRVSWDRDESVRSCGGVAYTERVPFVGIFLQYVRSDPSREASMCLDRLKKKEIDVDLTVAEKRARKFARVLGCPVRAR